MFAFLRLLETYSALHNLWSMREWPCGNITLSASSYGSHLVPRNSVSWDFLKDPWLNPFPLTSSLNKLKSGLLKSRDLYSAVCSSLPSGSWTQLANSYYSRDCHWLSHLRSVLPCLWVANPGKHHPFAVPIGLTKPGVLSPSFCPQSFVVLICSRQCLRCPCGCATVGGSQRNGKSLAVSLQCTGSGPLKKETHFNSKTV